MKKHFWMTVGLTVGFAGAAFAHKGHEHASNIPTHVQWGLSGIKELINVHPLFVHFVKAAIEIKKLVH